MGAIKYSTKQSTRQHLQLSAIQNVACRFSLPTTTTTTFQILLFVLFILLVHVQHVQSAPYKRMMTDEVAITGYRDKYDHSRRQQDLVHDKAHEFSFERFQSPSTIQKALKNTKRKSPFKRHHGKDGRKGHVSNTKLVGDWVLAESKQVAVQCTTKEVLQAYLTGDLQQQWNDKEVMECSFKKKSFANHSDERGKAKMKDNLIGRASNFKSPSRDSIVENTRNKSGRKDYGKYYQQDLVLRSQRIIRSHTGIMKYSQIITIDKVGRDGYVVLVHLDPEKQNASATAKKPFDSLSVYVGLEQMGDDAHIYAAGVMKVNRKVVPNLVVFDASGIAGGMAGKATLWLAGYFDQRKSRLMLSERIND